MPEGAVPRVLVVDDDPSVLRVLELILQSAPSDYEVTAVSDSEEACRMLEAERFDLLVSDIVMEPVTGIDLFHMARQHHPELPALMISGYATMDAPVEDMQEGVFESLSKPFTPAQFLSTVEKTLENAKSAVWTIDLARTPQALRFSDVVAESPKMKHVCDFVQRVANMDIPILILGPSGVGKELVARTIHAESDRKDRDFLAVNCAGLPVSFLESLFEPGSAAGAEHPNVGTLLLKELGVLPLDIQDRLLELLEQRAGSRKTDEAVPDVRILASTRQSLDSRMEDGTFRQSLHKYFSVISVAIPPLKERREDILPLVSHFLRLRTEGDLPTLTSEARDAFAAYPWPGNVAELREAIDAMLASEGSGQIVLGDLPPDIISHYKAG